MREKSIHGVGGTVYYWTNNINSNIALVFCHGLTADHHLFDKQVDYFKDRYKIIVWDWPLHGKSRPYSEFSYNKVNNDLKKIIDNEKINKVVIVGQSAGGYIAQNFINEYPEIVVGFIGIGTTPFGQQYYKASELFWIKHFKPIAKLYPYKSYCKACVKSVALTKEAKLSMQKTLEALGKDDMLIAVKAVYDEFLRKEDEVLMNCPVLLTLGSEDKTGYVRKYNEAWAKKRGYSLVIIDDAAHNANYDNFKKFNDLVINFIENEVKV